MIQSGRSRCWKLGMVSYLVMGGAIPFWIASLHASLGDCALAQIIPDTTLGNENSTVTSTGSVDQINGGVTRGANLFHSFQEFNIGNGRSAFFSNPPGIENILSRVTGANPSNILGTLGVSGGNANLFLINPNGIIFGQNARLDVGGSFVATTANAIGLASGDIFSANPREPLPSQLLNVNPNAFLFNQIAAQPIINRSIADSTGLKVDNGQSLLLVGGEVRLEGGGLTALGGRIELGGVSEPGIVGLTMNGKTLSLTFPANVVRADASLTNGSIVNVAAGGGGSIAINARNLSVLERSGIRAGIETGLGSVSSQAGDIEMNATGTINLTDNSSISNGVLTGGVGKGGDINITAGSLFGTNGARLTTNASGQGDAGSVTIAASDTVSFDEVTSNGLSSGVFSIVGREHTGKGGDISIITGSLSLTNGALVSTETFGRGDGGSIRITASDTLSFDGLGSNGLSSGLLSGTRTPATGRGGDITVTTGVLRLTNGAVLSARTWNPYSGGNITVDAHHIELSGGGQLLTTAYSSGRAGNITVNATDGITISGSDPTFEARSAQFTDPSKVDQADAASGIFANTTPIPGVTDQGRATGPGGDISITTGQLIVRDGAKVAVDSKGSGNAGNLQATAGSIHLDNNAVLNAETTAGQGNINLETEDLVLRSGSKITTNATGNAIGGNIALQIGVLAALENSDISANAQRGSGGRIIINAQAIFGTQYRDKSTPESDITATSDLGPHFSGIVQINTLGLDPMRGLINLPTQPVNAELAQGCQAGGGQQQSKFVVIGRGGLPPNPKEALSSDDVFINWIPLTPGGENPSSPAVSVKATNATPAPLVEAQGWVMNNKGQVVLTASAPTVTPHSPWLPPNSCATPQSEARTGT